MNDALLIDWLLDEEDLVVFSVIVTIDDSLGFELWESDISVPEEAIVSEFELDLLMVDDDVELEITVEFLLEVVVVEVEDVVDVCLSENESTLIFGLHLARSKELILFS